TCHFIGRYGVAFIMDPNVITTICGGSNGLRIAKHFQPDIFAVIGGCFYGYRYAHVYGAMGYVLLDKVGGVFVLDFLIDRWQFMAIFYSYKNDTSTAIGKTDTVLCQLDPIDFDTF